MLYNSKFYHLHEVFYYSAEEFLEYHFAPLCHIVLWQHILCNVDESGTYKAHPYYLIAGLGEHPTW